MNIIVLYSISEKKTRKTIEESLYCFSEYDCNNSYYYFNIFDSFSVAEMDKNISDLKKISAMIIHYSAVAKRYSQRWWGKNYDNIVSFINLFDCPKIIIPQDEYNFTADLQKLIKDCAIEVIYTCADSEDYEKLYPHSLGYKKISTVYTGYIDEKTLTRIAEKSDNNIRPIDVGYRGRKLPYWLGKYGQLKTELAEQFLNYLQNNETGLNYDIRNTVENAGAFLGSDWTDFLLNCRTMLGCLGGSGLIDWDGSIKAKVDGYMAEHPNASFEECEKNCFPGRDNEIHLFALSPRHFECAMTKTCQLLVEGDYAGVFEAGRDYIEIKKDFSNLDEVIEKVKDISYCKWIANNCYEDVVESGKYTYRKFVEKVLDYENIIDKGDEYLDDLDKYCKMSHVEATRDYGIFNYRLIRAGKHAAVKRLFRFRYWLIRVNHIVIKMFRVIISPFRNTRIFALVRKKWLQH